MIFIGAIGMQAVAASASYRIIDRQVQIVASEEPVEGAACFIVPAFVSRDSVSFEAGLESLQWLAELQRADTNGGHFVPIGSNGFYQRGGERARFDQQPVEAQAMVSACLEAHRVTGDKGWHNEARRAFDWFLGRNDLNLPIYDPVTGGCRDGLHSDRANENQGAESSLAYLQAVLEMRLAETTLLSMETGAR